jgi:hypothetical protein
MKALMILGAIAGFLIGAGFGYAGSNPWPDAFWRACVAAFMAAVLTRWWGRVWMKGLRDAVYERRAGRPSLAERKPVKL